MNWRQEIKSTLLWFVIIILSLKVYGTYLDHKHQKEVAERWSKKSSKILENLFYFFDDKEYLSQPLEKRRAVVEKYMDDVLFQDPDYDSLSSEQTAIFDSAVGTVIRLIEENSTLKPAGGPLSEVDLPHR